METLEVFISITATIFLNSRNIWRNGLKWPEGHTVYFLRESQMWYIDRQQCFLESILKEKNTAKECYSRKKAVWKWGVLCGSDEIANIEGSGSIFHQHVWRMVGRVSYWVEHSGLMVVRKCGRVFESLFLVFFHVKVMPSVYCQRPGSTFVQMVPSCIWESPIAPEPSPLPLLSSLISSPSSFSPPSYLSFRPNLLLLLSLFLSCLAASHLEHHSFLLFFPHSTFTSASYPLPHPSAELLYFYFLPLFPPLILPLLVFLVECQRKKGYEKKPD